MNIPGLTTVVVCYGLIAVLLLSLNVVSLWRWWIKAAAVIVTAFFVAASYAAINGMLGWPTTKNPPGRFHLLATHIIEPDKATAADGALYLWMEELDEQNLPQGAPRAFQLPYNDELAREMDRVQQRLDEGEQIMGVVDEAEAVEVEQEKIRIGEMNENAELSTATDTVPFQSDGLTIEFEDLPPVELPDKGPL